MGRLKNRTICCLVFAVIISFIAAFCLRFGRFVFANDEKSVSQISFVMEKGAYIYNNEQNAKRGIRFGATMSESDYNALLANVGEGKKYSTVTFGVIIAPAEYETTYGKFDEKNLFGESAIYDWAEWSESDGWIYTDNDKTRVINIERSTLSIESGSAACYGAITTILPENLLNPFKGVAYIAAEKNDGGFEYTFAMENDNDRTCVYVAQRRREEIKNEIADLDPDSEAAEIESLNAESKVLGSTYITDAVKKTDANYTVEHYYKKPAGGYFLFETTEKTAKIDSALDVENASGSSVAGVLFDKENGGNESPTVVYAQNKSVVKAYYDVIYGEDGDGNETLFDISSAEDYDVEASVINVYSADMIKISDENNKIPNANIVNMGKGEHELYVLTQNGFEKYSVIAVTHLIETGDEFISVMSSYKGAKAGEDNATSNWYMVLTNDIDCGGKSVSRNSGADRFWATFNGLGHSITNITTSGQMGIFGTLQSSNGSGGIIKNVAFEIVAKAGYYQTALLCYNAFGAKVDNVYVKGYYNEMGGDSRWLGNAGITFGSCPDIVGSIFDISYSNSKSVKDYIFNGGGTTSVNLSDNVYTIGENCFISPGKTERSYGDFDSFYTENKSNITAANGFNKYWNVTDDGLYFGDMLIKSKEYAETWKYDSENKTSYGTYSSAWGAKDVVTIDAAELSGEVPVSVMLGGKILSVNENGIATIDMNNYSLGSTYPLLIKCQAKIVSLPLMLVSQNINSVDAFRDLVRSDWGSGSVTESWYAVLTKDLDLTSLSSIDEVGCGNRFYATFDGQGHSIRNIPIDQSLFGIFFGHIKNIALVNIKDNRLIDNHGLGYGPFGSVNGSLSNVYVSIEDTGSNESASAGIIANLQSMKVENCVFDVKFADNNIAETTYAINGLGNHSSNITNSYFLGNADKIQPGDDNKPYVSGELAKAVTEGAVTFSIDNGFNHNWKVVSEKGTTTVYFGNVVVDVYTA